MTSEAKLPTPSNQPVRRTVLVRVLLGLSLLGLADATYLTVSYFTDSVPACSVVQGCEVVLNSVYATVGPVPLALMGVVYYLTLVLLSMFYLDSRRMSLLKMLSRLTWIGCLMSIWLVFLQAVILQAWCQYCLLSAGLSVLLWLVGRFLVDKKAKAP